jgi:hypothetical protein
MRALLKGFFWGPASHKPVAWLGAGAGVVVVALPFIIAFLGTGGHPLFLLALLFTGMAETGWAIELLPRQWMVLAGWGRVLRWLCAAMGLLLAILSLVGQLAPLWFAGVIGVGALLLVFEMAPGGYANQA